MLKLSAKRCRARARQVARKTSGNFAVIIDIARGAFIQELHKTCNMFVIYNYSMV
jgi:hypothetical protein